MKSRSGFTLIELLVVLVVLAILLTMTAFAYSRQQADSRNQRRVVDAVTLTTEMDAYYQRHGNYPITCGFPSSNLVYLQSCSNASGFYTASSMQSPDTIAVNPPAGSVQATLSGITKNFRDPSADNSAPQINHLSGSAVLPTSYFLFSPDMIYGGVGETNTQKFINPSGGTLTCKYSLEAAASHQASLPHQYIIGVPNEVTGSWSFLISPKSIDNLQTTWEPNSGSDSACTPISLSDLS